MYNARIYKVWLFLLKEILVFHFEQVSELHHHLNFCKKRDWTDLSLWLTYLNV